MESNYRLQIYLMHFYLVNLAGDFNSSIIIPNLWLNSKEIKNNVLIEMVGDSVKIKWLKFHLAFISEKIEKNLKSHL